MSGAKPTCCTVSILIAVVLIVEEDIKIARRTNQLIIHNLFGADKRKIPTFVQLQ